MNPIRDTAVWAVSLLPDTAPEWLVAGVAFTGIIAALVAIVAPPCLVTVAIIRWRERHERA